VDGDGSAGRRGGLAVPSLPVPGMGRNGAAGGKPRAVDRS
jgi:hypothetical protein